ncbi:hypothetical protein A33I_08915 [Alkalihalophilus marmarensis DSM 21297]|jgi:hypothetical protein|uniref:Uncharacterized protein n=1 Tax=Alkalihalophilus marmarensis DSM 21297 TaxID=1188261 RepID=U6STU7_9BACI|nr:hypothetical protein A33I_08915 [Alkalihalophilus marmarensis DSM 21297]
MNAFPFDGSGILHLVSLGAYMLQVVKWLDEAYHTMPRTPNDNYNLFKMNDTSIYSTNEKEVNFHD